MRAAIIKRTTKTTNRNWIALQDLVGLAARSEELMLARTEFVLEYEPHDEALWKQDVADHKAKWTDAPVSRSCRPSR